MYLKFLRHVNLFFFYILSLLLLLKSLKFQRITLHSKSQVRVFMSASFRDVNFRFVLRVYLLSLVAKFILGLCLPSSISSFSPVSQVFSRT